MKKIIKSLCFSLLAFMFAIGSIFLPIGSKHSNQYASADVNSVSITFDSSNIILSRIASRNYASLDSASSNFSDYAGYTMGGNYTYFSNVSFQLNRTADVGSAGQFILLPSIKAYSTSTIGLVKVPSANPTNYQELYFDNPTYLPTQPNEPRRVKTDIQKFYYRYDSTSYVTIIGFVCVSPEFEDNPERKPSSLVITSVEISNFNDFCIQSFDLSSYVTGTNMNVVCYTDDIGYKFIFLIPIVNNYVAGSQYYYEYRKYFLINDFNSNSYYQQGLSDGKSLGYTSGYDKGYSTGQNSGYSNGYEDGKIDGALDSQNFTFVGLFSAILDTPVKILTNLFNFDFLGINLWAFFTSILTIGLIVFVVKIFLRR